MTKEALIELINMEIDRFENVYLFRQNIEKIIDLYDKENRKQSATNGSQLEISDEEIDREAVTNESLTTFETFEKFCWKEGAKWYREKLKTKQ